MAHRSPSDFAWKGVRVSPTDGAVQARVLLSRQFVGRSDLLSLAVDGVERPIRARIRRATFPTVCMRSSYPFDPQEAFVFEDSSGSA